MDQNQRFWRIFGGKSCPICDQNELGDENLRAWIWSIMINEKIIKKYFFSRKNIFFVIGKIFSKKFSKSENFTKDFLYNWFFQILGIFEKIFLEKFRPRKNIFYEFFINDYTSYPSSQIFIAKLKKWQEATRFDSRNPSKILDFAPKLTFIALAFIYARLYIYIVAGS